MNKTALSYPQMEGLSFEQEKAIHQFESDNALKYENIKCSICESSLYKILFRNDRYGIPQDTVMCRNCGLVYSNPRMTEESTTYFYKSDLYRKIYNGIEQLDNYDEYYKRTYKTGKSKPLFDSHYPGLYFDFINFHIQSYESVCEIGAGGGWNLLPFLAAGKKVKGYEPSPVLVNLGRSKNIDLVNGFVGNVTGEYDLVILKHVLEHFHDPVNVVRTMRNNIKRYLFIEVPGFNSKIPSIQNAHNYYFSINTLEVITSKAGFKKIAMDYCINNDFILGLFEKIDDKTDFYYSASDEIKRILSIYRRFRYRLFFSCLLKMSGFYMAAKHLKRKLLKGKSN
jgi:hypothetical protein